MKKIIFLSFFFICFCTAGMAQDSTQQKQLNQLFSEYNMIKGAVVAENATTAASHAEAFLKILNGIDYKLVSEGNVNALLSDATAISVSADIQKQKRHFQNLSENIAALANAFKPTLKIVSSNYRIPEKFNEILLLV